MADLVLPLTWGVSVNEVLALAPHVILASPPAGGTGTWDNPQTGKTTETQLAQWIADVAAMVDLHLHRRVKLTDPLMVVRFERGARSITTVGAAATMVSALYPTKAGINEQASYSAELWARYNRELEVLAEALDSWIVDLETPPLGPIKGAIGGSFPETAFPDGMVW